MEKFETFRTMQIDYSGFVWKKDGSIYSVLARPHTIESETLPYPCDKMIFQRGTIFHITKTEHVVSLLKLKEDFVFDENGNFIEKKAGADITSNNPSRIFIRKLTHSGIEDIPISQASLINAESYTKIFTSILSDFKDTVIAPRHLVGPILFLLGQKITALKPVGALGSPKGSSIASWGLSKILTEDMSEKKRNFLKRVFGKGIMKGSKNTGRIIGRFVPYVGGVLTAADAIYSAYELGGEYGPMTMHLKRQREQFEYESVILRDLDQYIDE